MLGYSRGHQETAGLHVAIAEGCVGAVVSVSVRGRMQEPQGEGWGAGSHNEGAATWHRPEMAVSRCSHMVQACDDGGLGYRVGGWAQLHGTGLSRRPAWGYRAAILCPPSF